jgi:hypothetical protein
MTPYIDPAVPRRMPTIDPKDLIGRTLLKDKKSDGHCLLERIKYKDVKLKHDP